MACLNGLLLTYGADLRPQLPTTHKALSTYIRHAWTAHTNVPIKVRMPDRDMSHVPVHVLYLTAKQCPGTAMHCVCLNSPMLAQVASLLVCQRAVQVGLSMSLCTCSCAAPGWCVVLLPAISGLGWCSGCGHLPERLAGPGQP